MERNFMIINGLMKTTLLDYPGHVAATVFLGGCNFRCPFCHNRDMVVDLQNTERIDEEEFFRFLSKRTGVLTGVCVTGGEPTLRPDLEDFLRRIKDLGFLVKLDTNGSHPSVIRRLNEEGLFDYVAMDIKSSLNHYSKCIDVPAFEAGLIKESVDYIKSSLKQYEFRTTVVRELHTAGDFEEIALLLKGAQNYFLQYYRDSDNIICPNTFHCCSEEEMNRFAGICRPYMEQVSVRGEMPD